MGTCQRSERVSANVIGGVRILCYVPGMAAGDDRDAEHGAPALVPAISKQRLARLRKQHAELVAKVRHKRAAIERVQTEAPPIARDLGVRAAEVRAEHRAYDHRVHAAFEAALRDRPRADRLAVRHLYQWLQSAGALSERAADPDRSPRTTPELPPDERAAAPMRALRPTFLRLAAEYHPDKAGDDERRAAHTEIMKDLNRAYAGGDVSRLLELERSLGDESGAAAELAPATLESEVAALREQLRDMSHEMRQLRTHYPGAIVIEYRRLAQAGCPDPVGAIVDELRLAAAQLRRLCELVERFRDGDLDVDALYEGPPEADDSWISEVFAAARQSRCARSGSRRAGRRRPG